MDYLKIILTIPLFGVLLIIYLILVSSGVDFSAAATPLFSMSLMSGASWSPTSSDILIVFGVIILYVEIVKSTRTGTASTIEHVLSTFVFITFLVLFLTWGIAGTSTFLILALMSLLDVIAGFTITIATARRDMNWAGGPPQ